MYRNDRGYGVTNRIVPGLDERGFQRGPRWNRAAEERAWRAEIDKDDAS